MEHQEKLIKAVNAELEEWRLSGDVNYLHKAKSNDSLQLGCFKPKAIKLIIAGMKKQKVTLTALKHELDRTTVATYTGRYEGVLPIYRCKKCGGTFENFGQSHCCWCGRKIEGCK